MRLTFLGATHEVTGSCYYLEAAGKKFLVDCGMEQGPNIYENKPIPVPASQLDFVLITHAHIDHTGNLPLLYAHGFRGPIYMTPATVALGFGLFFSSRSSSNFRLICFLCNRCNSFRLLRQCRNFLE